MSQISSKNPSNQGKTNENIARIIAAFTIPIVLTGVYFNLPIILVVLAVDFSLRALKKGSYSPLKYVATKISHLLGMPEKMEDAAPKRFTSLMGLFICIFIATLQWFSYHKQADYLAAALIVCAALESISGFCIGDIAYTYFFLPLLSKEDSEQSTISINL